jgi:hypothetical protein
MAFECWVCGKAIRRSEPAESLPDGTVAVHARCVERNVTGRAEQPAPLKQAA